MFFAKKRRAELCAACAREMQANGFAVKPEQRGVNQKVTCERCGRRRYGGTYELEGMKRPRRQKRMLRLLARLLRIS